MMTTYKLIAILALALLMVSPVSSILNCQCDGSRDPRPYCISYGNTMDCDLKDRIPTPEPPVIIEVYVPDGSKEHPIMWDADNPSADGYGWYYYVSPSRPFYLPFNALTIIGG